MKEDRGDISKAQDLTMAVVNLISLEEHLAFTAAKTGEDDFYEMGRDVRALRVRCMKDLIGEPRGELWCSTKHTLSAVMRLLEVASKESGKKCAFYRKAAFDLYKMFWLFREVGMDERKKSQDKTRRRG
ncbi:MAG: hypothetical protein HY366_01750 [Candidatus Aenigmarchaeota archaeon]|nr:hypothetical protein [Candidatus Aenigmarchaeota archaeon]